MRELCIEDYGCDQCMDAHSNGYAQCWGCNDILCGECIVELARHYYCADCAMEKRTWMAEDAPMVALSNIIAAAQQFASNEDFADREALRSNCRDRIRYPKLFAVPREAA